MAHIGVLKALEEHGVQIDFIAGTSSGALIGGMYASGFSPDEIDSIARTDKFQLMVNGLIEERYMYYFKQAEINASWLTLKMNSDSILLSSLPTKFTSSTLTDFEMMNMLSGANALAKHNFDSLFVPFRCVASDIYNKETVIFDKGHLNKSIRASLTYPFFIEPIRIDGRLLFDGGLYNNFPAGVLYDTFHPDYIIGSNVSENVTPVKEGDMMSMIFNMVISQTDFSLPCQGIMITPELSEVGTFEFDKIKLAIRDGYKTTVALIDSMRAIGIPMDTSNLVSQRRADFRNKIPEMQVGDIKVEGLKPKTNANFIKTFSRNKNSENFQVFKKRYFQIAQDRNIRFIYPTANYNPSTEKYDMDIYIQREKDFQVEIGGVFSSRPINTGYLGLEYKYLGRFGLTLKANSYFGKFYGSVYTSAKLDFSSKLPFFIEPYYSINRWDYFRSFATFFEEVNPSFIVLREQFGGLKVGFPAGNKGRFVFEGQYSDLDYRYYQVENFDARDTADRTNFYPLSGRFMYERNTLNRKYYANAGTYLRFQTIGLKGDEVTLPGTTSSVRDSIVDSHAWIYAKLRYENYFKRKGIFKFGFLVEGVYSTQKFFENYTASLLAAPAFEPIPEAKTLFLNQYRSFQYMAGGVKMVVNFTDNIELRLGGYFFQPAWYIQRGANEKAVRGALFMGNSWIGSGAFVLHTPIGPLSLTSNYYYQKEIPWSVSVNFGYLLHNSKAIQ